MVKRILGLVAVAVLVASCGNGVQFITPTAGQTFSLSQGASQGYYFTVTLNQYVGSTITFAPSPYLANLVTCTTTASGPATCASNGGFNNATPSVCTSANPCPLTITVTNSNGTNSETVNFVN